MWISACIRTDWFTFPRSAIITSSIRWKLFRSATSVAANYAEASVPESKKDFAHKLDIALKELVESRMWLRIIGLKGYIDPQSLKPLVAEIDELIRIFHASVITTRNHLAAEQ